MMRLAAGATVVVLCWAAIPCVAQGVHEPDRARVVNAVADFLGVPREWVSIASLSGGTAAPGAPIRWRMAVWGGEFVVTNGQGHLVGRLHAAVDIETYHVACANWNRLTAEERQSTARSFVSAQFPGWSDDMVLVTEGGSPGSFGQAMAFFPESVSCFRWAEKRDNAWTGTYVQVTVLDSLPRMPVQYGGYVAQPRSLADVRVPEERAIEVALEEARRRGLEDPEVKQADLYLDHHIRHFPHWMIEVTEPQPRGQATHPLHASVMVDAVSGEVLDLAATMPSRE